MNRESEKGFTLLEMAIVIIIGGVLLSFLGTALLAYLKQSRIETTEFRLAKIQEAMTQYLSVNGHYPCVANRNLGADDAQFGRMVTANCDVGGSFTGTNVTTGRAGIRVRIGAVPTRTLNLPDEMIADAWGHKFTYAVTAPQATNLQYTADGGAISVIDGAGNSLVNPNSTAHYVVVSHGETGDGGYPVINATSPSVPCRTAALDGANCDNSDAIFRSTLVTSEATVANFYDDYVYFQGQTAPVFTIPAGAVMAFNLGACPDGWTRYTQGEARFIIGARAADLVRDPYIMAPADPLVVPDIVMNIDRGVSSDGDVEAVIPPYVALLYCEKLPN
jgi:prepilin-type N-terminal cleavage/methylation domain-containing protein